MFRIKSENSECSMACGHCLTDSLHDLKSKLFWMCLKYHYLPIDWYYSAFESDINAEKQFRYRHLMSVKPIDFDLLISSIISG